VQQEPENFHDVHRHNFFEIIWFMEVHEKSHLELDFESYKLENNQICIIAPGQAFNMKIERGRICYGNKPGNFQRSL
jgi:hypothetical protein